MGRREVKTIPLHVLVKKVALSLSHDVDELQMVGSTLMAYIMRELEQGNEVRLRGIGTLCWLRRKATRRKLRGEFVEVPESYVLRIRPNPRLKRVDFEMEKLGVLIDPNKLKEQEKEDKEKTAEKSNVNVPWDPEKGTEPYEYDEDPDGAL